MEGCAEPRTLPIKLGEKHHIIPNAIHVIEQQPRTDFVDLIGQNVTACLEYILKQRREVIFKLVYIPNSMGNMCVILPE
jgi:hypothetical protein